MNIPILSSLIFLPTIGAIFIFFSRSKNEKYNSSKYVALFITIANFFLSIYFFNLYNYILLLITTIVITTVTFTVCYILLNFTIFY